MAVSIAHTEQPVVLRIAVLIALFKKKQTDTTFMAIVHKQRSVGRVSYQHQVP